MQITNAADRVAATLEAKRSRRAWNPDLHPRDSKGRFIETGGVAKMWGGGLARVIRALGGRNVLVESVATHKRSTVHASRLTMVARPDGTAPTRSKRKVRDEDERRTADPRRGTGTDADDTGDDGDTPDEPHAKDDQGEDIGEDKEEDEDQGEGPEPEDDDPIVHRGRVMPNDKDDEGNPLPSSLDGNRRTLHQPNLLPIDGGERAGHVAGRGDALRARGPEATTKNPDSEEQFQDAEHARAAVTELTNDYLADLLAVMPRDWDNTEAREAFDDLPGAIDLDEMIDGDGTLETGKRRGPYDPDDLSTVRDAAEDAERLAELAEADGRDEVARYAQNLADALNLTIERFEAHGGKKIPKAKKNGKPVPKAWADAPVPAPKGGSGRSPRPTAKKTAAANRRKDPNRRFKTLDDVRNHWTSGNLTPYTSDKDAQDKHTAATAELFDKLKNPQLSRNGHFVIGEMGAQRRNGEIQYGWGVILTDSGVRLAMPTRKGEAADFVKRLEAAQLNGEAFDWDAPNYQSRLNTPEGRDMVEGAANAARQAFADKAAKKRAGAAARTTPAPSNPDQAAAQQVAERTGVPAANVAVGHVGPNKPFGDERGRPRNDAELRDYWKRGGDDSVSPEQRDLMRTWANRERTTLYLSDHRGFAIIENPDLPGAPFEVRTSGAGGLLRGGPMPALSRVQTHFKDRDSADRFALYLYAHLRDENGNLLDWGSPTFDKDVANFKSDRGEPLAKALYRSRGQFDRENGDTETPAAKYVANLEEQNNKNDGASTGTPVMPASDTARPDETAKTGQQRDEQPGAGEDSPAPENDSKDQSGQGSDTEEPAPAEDEPDADAQVADALAEANKQILPVINDLERIHGRDAAQGLALRAAEVVDAHEQGELSSSDAVREYQNVLDDIQRATRGLEGRDNMYAQDMLRLARENVGIARQSLDEDRKRRERSGVRGSGSDVLENVSAERSGADGRDGAGGVRRRAVGGDPRRDSGSDGRPGAEAGGGNGRSGTRRGAEDGAVPRQGSGAARDGVRDGEGAGHGDEGHAEGEAALAGRVTFGSPEQEADAPSFTPPADGGSLVPSTPLKRAQTNIAAIELLHRLEQEQRPATPDEQQALARWSGWGAVPQIFKPKPDAQFAPLQKKLRELLSEDEWLEARANTKNAHYTDPKIVQQIWDAVAELGFADGDVLEPGSGSGNFIGYAPEDADLTGVELDPITARISKALYPRAEIRNESFGATRAPNGTFDLAIGNVPFGRYKVPDLVHNKGNHSIHNHFILKSMDLTRPGGLVAMVTSSLTMDGHGRKAEAARMEMAAKGDLVAAIRLPSGTHQRTAGTNVVTDLLIFRPREREKTFTSGRTRKGDIKAPSERGPKDPPMWVHSLPRFGLPGQADPERDENAQPVFYNSYFHEHPEQILGSLSVGHGLNRTNELRVDSKGDPIANLHRALKRAVTQAQDNGLTYQERPEGRRSVKLLPPGSPRVDGHVQAEPDGSFTQVRDGMVHPFDVPKSQADEARKLLAIRDTFQSLLAEESRKDADESLIERLRAALNEQYEAYAAKHGAINRFEWSKRTVEDPVTGEKVQKSYRKRAARGGLFRHDPTMANIAALDEQDDSTGKVTRAAIFGKRQGVFREIAEHADDPQDAIAVVLDRYGRLTPEGLAEVMGTDEQTATSRLLAARFPDPDTDVDYPLAFQDPGGDLVPTADYLSGNVRQKLAAARAAAIDDPSFEVNVDHLERVIPPDLSTGEIAAPMGASWIGREAVEQFLQQTLNSESIKVSWQGGALWAVDAPDGIKRQIAYRTRDTWSAPGYDALKIAEAILTNRKIRVTVKTSEGTEFDPEATADAESKAELLKEEFTDWLWSDPDRAEKYKQLYNEAFNSLAPRSYDGQRRTIPGLVTWFKPHPHQHAAVSRMVNEPSVLLAHEVGAGKTAEMAMGVMELRRLGLINKAAMVVPGHMLDQFRTEFAELFPESVANNRILTASSDDLTGNGRREFIARAASGDYDAIILTQTAFESIQMRPEVQEKYIRRRLEKLENAIRRQKEADGEDNDTRLVKRMETQLANLRTKLDKKLTGLKDQAGLNFEDMGVDYLVVDEAHMYKNLYTSSSIDAASIEGANRASDLDMKLEWLREHTGTGRVVTFATATPVANSIAEVHVMMRYLRPDLLRQMGIEEFDDFASTFAQAVSAIERSADGTYTEKTRLAAFQNVPELMRIWRAFADVKTSEDLDLPVPDVAGGKAVTITMPQSEAQEEYELQIQARAARLANGNVDPREDNHLKLLSDGRAAALDPRLVDPDAGPGNKLPTVAANITRIYGQTKDTVYPSSKEDDTPHETPGGLQIVFLDLGTPKDPGKTKKKKKTAEGDADAPVEGDGEEQALTNFSTYDELKKLLIARGVPSEKVRFIHEAKDDAAKARLFHEARTGKIAVLIGSTFKMGTGTNIQLRATALHHVDAPWRPADVEQRNGRIIRQGNANPEVAIFQYATERSTDAKFWEAIARKARFIRQLMRGSLTERVVEDIGEVKFDADEASALVAGDPHLIAQSQLRPVVKRLRSRFNAHQRSQEGFARAIRDAETSEEYTGRAIATLNRVLEERKPTRGKDFNARIGTTDFEGSEGRQKARSGLNTALRAILADGRKNPWAPGTPAKVIGQVGGLDITARHQQKWNGFQSRHEHVVTLDIPAIPDAERDYRLEDLVDVDKEPQALPLMRVEDEIAGIETRIRRSQNHLADKQRAAEQASARVGKPFELADEYDKANRQLEILNQIMRLKAKHTISIVEGEKRDAAIKELDAELREMNGDEEDVLAQVSARDLDLNPRTPAPPAITQDSEGRTRFVWPDAEARDAAREKKREAKKKAAADREQRRQRTPAAPDALGMNDTELNAESERLAGLITRDEASEADVVRHAALDRERRSRAKQSNTPSTSPETEQPAGNSGPEAPQSAPGGSEETPVPLDPEKVRSDLDSLNPDSSSAGETSTAEEPEQGTQTGAPTPQPTRAPTPRPFANDSEWRIALGPVDVAETRLNVAATATWGTGERVPGSIPLIRRAVMDAVAAHEDEDYDSAAQRLGDARETAASLLDTLEGDERVEMEGPLRSLLGAIDTYLPRHRATQAKRQREDGQQRDLEADARAQFEAEARARRNTTDGPQPEAPRPAAPASNTAPDTNEAPQGEPKADEGTAPLDPEQVRSELDALNEGGGNEDDSDTSALSDTAEGGSDRPSPGDQVLTPDGPGEVMAVHGDSVLTRAERGTRPHALKDVTRPDGTPFGGNNAVAKKEQQNAERLAQAATSEGFELSTGNRLRDLDMEAGHGTIVDGDGNTVGWVRARIGDNGRRYWWGQDAEGGAPGEMQWHEDLPAQAGAPPVRAAGAVRFGPKNSGVKHTIRTGSNGRDQFVLEQRKHVTPDRAITEMTLTPAQVRELGKLTLSGTYADGTPIDTLPWNSGHRRYSPYSAQAGALAAAAREAAAQKDQDTPQGRRDRKVLLGAARKMEFQEYDSARRAATLPAPGETDLYDKPYQPREEEPEDAVADATAAPEGLEPSAPEQTRSDSAPTGGGSGANTGAPAQTEPDNGTANSGGQPVGGGRYLTPDQLGERQGVSGYVTPEDETELFGPDAKARIAHLASLTTQVSHGETWAAQTWYGDRYVGFVRAAGSKGSLWEAHLPFSDVYPRFKKRQTALAYLALTSDAQGNYSDLTRISPDQQHAFRRLDMDRGGKYDAFSVDYGAEGQARLTALRDVVGALQDGRTPSGNVADDLGHVIDGAQWLYEHAPHPDQADDQLQDRLGGLIRWSSEFLNTLRPDDRRAGRHDHQRNQDADAYVRDHATAEAKKNADTVPPDALRNGDLVELSGHTERRFGPERRKTQGYVVGEPIRAMVDIGRNAPVSGWRITVSAEPFGAPSGIRAYRQTFLIPDKNKGIIRFVRAEDTGLPTDQIIRRKEQDRAPGTPETASQTSASDVDPTADLPDGSEVINPDQAKIGDYIRAETQNTAGNAVTREGHLLAEPKRVTATRDRQRIKAWRLYLGQPGESPSPRNAVTILTDEQIERLAPPERDQNADVPAPMPTNALGWSGPEETRERVGEHDGKPVEVGELHVDGTHAARTVYLDGERIGRLEDANGMWRAHHDQHGYVGGGMFSGHDDPWQSGSHEEPDATAEAAAALASAHQDGDGADGMHFMPGRTVSQDEAEKLIASHLDPRTRHRFTLSDRNKRGIIGVHVDNNFAGQIHGGDDGWQLVGEDGEPHGTLYPTPEAAGQALMNESGLLDVRPHPSFHFPQHPWEKTDEEIDNWITASEEWLRTDAPKLPDNANTPVWVRRNLDELKKHRDVRQKRAREAEERGGDNEDASDSSDQEQSNSPRGSRSASDRDVPDGAGSGGGGGGIGVPAGADDENQDDEPAAGDEENREGGSRRRRRRDGDRPSDGAGSPDGTDLPQPPNVRDSNNDRAGGDDDDEGGNDRSPEGTSRKPRGLADLKDRYRSGQASTPRGANPEEHAAYLRSLADNGTLALSPGGNLITWSDDDGRTWQFGHAASGMHLAGWEANGEEIGGGAGARSLAGQYEQFRDSNGDTIDWASPTLDEGTLRAWHDADGMPLGSAVAQARQHAFELHRGSTGRSDTPAADAPGQTDGTPEGARRDGQERPEDGTPTTAGGSDDQDTATTVDAPASAAASQYAINAMHAQGEQRAGTVDGRRVPTHEEMKPYETEGKRDDIINEEGERFLFGSPERMRELAAQGFVPTPVIRSDRDGEIWRNGRLIGTLFAPHRVGQHLSPPTEVWWSEPSFGHSLNFSTREAAIAHVVLRDLERGEPDLSIVHPSVAWDMAHTNTSLGFPPTGLRGLETLTDSPEDMARYEAIRDMVTTLGRGETISGNVADDLDHLHDELRWLDAAHYKHQPANLKDRYILGPGWLAGQIREYLDVLRPEDPRAMHHVTRVDRAAEQFLRALRADGGEDRAQIVPVGDIRQGDVVHLEGRITGRYAGATSDKTGYVVEAPRKATLTTYGKRQKAWRITVALSTLGGHGADRETFIIPVVDNVRRLASANDITLPLDEHTYGRQVGDTPQVDATPDRAAIPEAPQPPAVPDETEEPRPVTDTRTDAPSAGSPDGTPADDPADRTGTDRAATAAPEQDSPAPAPAAPRTETPASRKKEEPPSAPDPDAAEEPKAPEPVGGRPAEWVKVSDLGLRDLVRIEGITKRGAPRTLAGYVADGPKKVPTTKAHRVQDMYRVLISKAPDGRGKQDSIWVMPDAAAARATRDDNDQVDGAPQSGADSDVLTGRIADRVPTDHNGNGLFPGSVVTDDDGREGVVTGASASNVRVQFGDDRTDDAQSPTSLNVTDGGAARPSGWTTDGHRVRPGNVVADRDGNMLGTVEDVDGDTASVATPQGMNDLSVADLRVVGSVRETDGPATGVRLETTTYGELNVGDVVFRERDVDGPAMLEILSITESDSGRLRLETSNTITGEVATRLGAFPNSSVVRVLDGDGKAPRFSPEDAPDSGITSHGPAPAVDPVTGPTVDPQLSPEERDAIDDLGSAPTDDPEVQQAAARSANDLPLLPGQAIALAGVLRDNADLETPEGRAAQRAADHLAAAAGDEPDGTARPEPGTIGAVGVGDTIALPGGFDETNLTAYKVVKIEEAPGGARVLTLEDEEGVRFTRTLASGEPLFQLPEPQAPDADDDAEPRDPNPAPDADRLRTDYADSVVRAVVDNAIQGTATPGSIHQLREQIAAQLTPQALRPAMRRARDEALASITDAGIDGDERKELVRSLREEAARARTDAIRAAVRTLDDLEPLDGESQEDTASRAADLLRLIPEALRNRPEPDSNDGDSRVDDAVTGHVDDAVGDALQDAEAGGLTDERRAEIVRQLADRMAANRDATARRIADTVPAGQRAALLPHILASLVALARLVVALVAAFLKALAKAWRNGREGLRHMRERIARFRRGLVQRVRTWPEARRLRRLAAGTNLPGHADGLHLGDRVAHWARLLPAPGRFGQVSRRSRWYRPASRASLAAGQLPPVQDGLRWMPDRAVDGGPGPQALRHLAAVRAAGLDVDSDVAARLAATAPELGDDPHGTVRHAANYADTAERRLRDLQAAAAGGAADADLEIDAARVEAQSARQEARRLQQAYAAALPDIVRDALAEIRDMGPAAGSNLVTPPDSDPEATRALVDVSRFIPRDWLTPTESRFLAARNGTAGDYDGRTATVADLGDAGRRTAANALLTHLQRNYPDLVAAQEAFHFSRTHRGRTGARRRTSLDVLLGRLFGNRATQGTADDIVPLGLADMFSGDWYKDDDLRGFLLGLLATR
ncbi:helicase-related protein [Streptomyces sp. NPDC054871]